MNDISNVTIFGRLTRDAESKYLANGTAMASFSIAVNRGVKKGDKWEDEASFFDCTIWGKTAENLGKFLVKGKQVGIVGSLKQERWEKEGQKHSKIVITVDTMQIIGDRKEGIVEKQEAKFIDDDVPF